MVELEVEATASPCWLATSRQHAPRRITNVQWLGLVAIGGISGYRGKNSNDPEWIMQDPRGYPEMERGGHSNPHLGRDVRVRQAGLGAALASRWTWNWWLGHSG